jgi:hypothetical protein
VTFGFFLVLVFVECGEEKPKKVREALLDWLMM